MGYHSFMYHVYSNWLHDHFMLVFCLCIVVLNIVILRRHFRRSIATSYYGMFFTLMTTNVVYGTINVAISTFLVLPTSLKGSAAHGSGKALHLLILTPHMTQQIVAVSAVFVALDRTLVFTLGTKYGKWNVSRNLSILAGAINLITFLAFICAVLLPARIPDLSLPLHILKNYFFAPTLVVEVVLYGTFIVLYRKFRKGKKQNQTAMNNKIFIFQMISNFLLSVLPNALVALRKTHYKWTGFRWIRHIEPFCSVLFAISVLLVSSSLLYFLRSRKNVVRVTSVENNGVTTPKTT